MHLTYIMTPFNYYIMFHAVNTLELLGFKVSLITHICLQKTLQSYSHSEKKKNTKTLMFFTVLNK